MLKFPKRFYDRYDPMQMFVLSFICYYITYISLVIHLATMVMMSMWCNYSKICIAYSLNVLMLHAFSWAIPTQVYRDWTFKRAVWYYVIAGVNLLIWLLGIIFGLVLYCKHTDGIMQFFGFAIFFVTIISQTPMVFMIIVSIIKLA